MCAGQVDATTLEIKLFNEAVVVYDSLYVTYTVVGLTASTYFVCFYNQSQASSSSPTYNTTGPLETVLVTIEIGGAINITRPAILQNSLASAYISATRISNHAAIVTFSDATANFGIRSVIISLESTLGVDASHKIYYGSSLLVTTGQTMATLPSQLVMETYSTTIYSDYESGDGSGEGRAAVAVLFSDISNDGTMTAAILQVIK
jgi:hypothetical protein